MKWAFVSWPTKAFPGICKTKNPKIQLKCAWVGSATRPQGSEMQPPRITGFFFLFVAVLSYILLIALAMTIVESVITLAQLRPRCSASNDGKDSHSWLPEKASSRHHVSNRVLEAQELKQPKT